MGNTHFFTKARFVKMCYILLWLAPHAFIISEIINLYHSKILKTLSSNWWKLDVMVLLCVLMAMINMLILAATTRNLRFSIIMALSAAMTYFLILVVITQL